MREIVFRLLRSDAASILRASVTREHQKILEAMRFIETNASRPLSIAGIAKAIAMSPSHFAHRFREFASISPMQYQKRIRLEAARLALLSHGTSVGAAAEQSGYVSASQFSREFKRQFGVSPHAYAEAFSKHATVQIDRV